MTSTAEEQATILRRLTPTEAWHVLGDAWWGGRHAAERRIDHNYTGNDDGSGYLLASVPLSWIRPNEAGDRYDGTVSRERALLYAQSVIDTPVNLVFGHRQAARGAREANVMDGGHRVSAARMRGDTHINAVMQASQFELLCAARALAAVPSGSTAPRPI